jgi:hypothetical protein
MDTKHDVGLADSKLNARYSKRQEPPSVPTRPQRPQSAMINGDIGLSKSQLNKRYSSQQDLSNSKLNQRYQNGPVRPASPTTSPNMNGIPNGNVPNMKPMFERHNSGLYNRPTDNTAKDKILRKFTKDKRRRDSNSSIRSTASELSKFVDDVFDNVLNDEFNELTDQSTMMPIIKGTGDMVPSVDSESELSKFVDCVFKDILVDEDVDTLTSTSQLVPTIQGGGKGPMQVNSPSLDRRRPFLMSDVTHLLGIVVVNLGGVVGNTLYWVLFSGKTVYWVLLLVYVGPRARHFTGYWCMCLGQHFTGFSVGLCGASDNTLY